MTNTSRAPPNLQVKLNVMHFAKLWPHMRVLDTATTVQMPYAVVLARMVASFELFTAREWRLMVRGLLAHGTIMPCQDPPLFAMALRHRELVRAHVSPTHKRPAGTPDPFVPTELQHAKRVKRTPFTAMRRPSALPNQV